MSEIIPAIIPKSFSDLQDKQSAVIDYVPLVHIDICDGVFVPNKTWPHTVPHDPDFVKILHEEEGFPYWEDLEFEVHLMVAKPEDEIQAWVSAGARRIIIHAESFDDMGKLQACAESFEAQFGSKGSVIALELGLAVSMQTSVESILPIVEYFDFVQCMSIDKIGSQGEQFDADVVPKIKALRDKFLDMPISVDGGVDVENAAMLVQAGADRLVVGSAIFGSQDILDTIDKLEDLFHQ